MDLVVLHTEDLAAARAIVREVTTRFGAPAAAGCAEMPAVLTDRVLARQAGSRGGVAVPLPVHRPPSGRYVAQLAVWSGPSRPDRVTDGHREGGLAPRGRSRG